MFLVKAKANIVEVLRHWFFDFFCVGGKHNAAFTKKCWDDLPGQVIKVLGINFGLFYLLIEQDSSLREKSCACGQTAALSRTTMSSLSKKFARGSPRLNWSLTFLLLNMGIMFAILTSALENAT